MPMQMRVDLRQALHHIHLKYRPLVGRHLRLAVWPLSEGFSARRFYLGLGL